MATTLADNRSLTGLAAATPDSRDRYVDFLRAAAILAVVFGHWLIAVVTWDPSTGAVTAGNALAEAEALQRLTWLFQVMPLFFVVGGFANRAALLAGRRRGEPFTVYLRSRVLRLTSPVLPLAGTWILGGAALGAAGLDGKTVRLVTDTMAQPLWFLAVYLLVSALAPWTLRLHERRPVATVVVLAVAAVVNDLAALPGVHVANYLFVFVLAHQVGYALGDGSLTRLRRRTLVVVTAAAGAALWALTAVGPYPLSMVGVPGAERSNMSPPSVCILVLTALHLGIVLLARPVLLPVLQRRVLWTAVVAVNGSIMTIFLWHLSALAVGAALLFATPVGFPQPEVATGAWWLTRLPWLVVLTVVLGGIVAVAGRVERSALLRRSPAGAPGASAAAAGASVVAAAAALTALALEGFGGGAALAAVGALYFSRRMLSGYR